MLVSFALMAIARALGETSEQGRPEPKVVITATPRLSRTIQRFEALWKDWAHCLEEQNSVEKKDPILDNLITRTGRVMAGSAIIFSNIKMSAKRGTLEIETEPLVKILKNTRKAIVSGQRITHVKEMESWVLPDKPPPGTPLWDKAFMEYERRRRINENASRLVERRKKPVQCCMFIALALFQFLYPEEVHDFVAEYEDEVVCETFNRSISIDDGKTYESLQMKDHCRERLTPPADRIPIWDIPFGEITCVPRFVRNPMTCGAPIVSNQRRIGKGEQEYINLNRNNRPQHLGSLLKAHTRLHSESVSSCDSQF